MKIAIASTTQDEQGEISVGGRAPYYLIVEDGKIEKSIKNPFAVGGGGAGISVAKMLADLSVEKVISSHFGDKMTRSLEERGINFEEVSGPISDYLEK